MFLSIKEILKGKSFEGSKVLAGGKGLSRPVGSVTVGEVPDIAEWLTGKELVLSTFFAVSEDRNARLEFCENIIESGAAALVVKSKRFVEEIDPEIIQLAEERDFPIIEVQPQVRWTQLIQEVSKRIIGCNIAMLERSEKIHNELLKIVIEGGGWNSIAATAAKLIKRPVILENVFKQILAEARAIRWDKDIIEELKKLQISDSAAGELLAKIENRRFLRLSLGESKLPAKVVVPIIVGGDVLGYVSTFEIEEEVNDLDVSALESTATVAALEMGRERVKFETEIRLYGDLLDDLISMTDGNEAETISRAKQFGVDLSRGVISFFIEPDGISARSKRELAEPYAETQGIFEFLQPILRVEIKNAIISQKRNGAMVILSPKKTWVPDEISSRVVSLAGRLQRACAGRFSYMTFSVGVGRYHGDITEIGKACEESAVSLDVGRKLYGPGKIAKFVDIGGYKIIFDLMERDKDKVVEFYEETLDPLAVYDREHKTELVSTLSAYFNNDESISKTSEGIYVHPKTIGYRLQRIKEITGLDVGRSEDKERLSMGLKAGQLLGRI